MGHLLLLSAAVGLEIGASRDTPKTKTEEPAECDLLKRVRTAVRWMEMKWIQPYRQILDPQIKLNNSETCLVGKLLHTSA